MVKPLRPNPCCSSTLFPTAHRIDHVPLMLKWPLICSPASLKERRENMFCHWFSHMKLISSPFTGSEAAVSKSAISLCFVSVSAGEILKSVRTKLVNFYILELCFFGVEANWSPLCLWELSTVYGLAVCWSFKVSLPTQSHFFEEVSVRSVRCASCSLIGLKCSHLWCGLSGDQPGEKKNPIV